jgi:membrane-bound lytic murein transglycosylase F
LKAAWIIVCLVAWSAPALAAKPPTDRYDDTFRKYSKRYFGPGFDWRIFKAQAMAESNLNPSARSHVGARGLMQLMPKTYREIQTKNREFGVITDTEWNIAAGIYYDRQLWQQWEPDTASDQRHRFVLGSYNAGRGTVLRARKLAHGDQLDPAHWTSIETVAPKVPRWRHGETIGYVKKIERNLGCMDDGGRVVRDEPLALASGGTEGSGGEATAVPSPSQSAAGGETIAAPSAKESP